MKLARLPFVAISTLLVLLLQQRIPSLPSALALRNLSDTWETQNANASTYLPDPSNCAPPQPTTHMDFSSFANITSMEQLHDAHATKGHPASSLSEMMQNSTHPLHSMHAENVSDCRNASRTTEKMHPPAHIHDSESKSRQLLDPSQKNAGPNQAQDIGPYIVMEVDEGAATPIHTTDASSNVKDSVQAMVTNDDGVVLVDAEHFNDNALAGRLSGGTPPPSDGAIHTAAQRSIAKGSVEVMEVGKDDVDVVLIDAEQLGGPTPPPSSPSINTAARSSVARDAVQVTTEASKGDVLWIHEQQLAGSSSPPSTPSIHTAVQSSIARETMKVLVTDEGDDGVVLVNEEQSGEHSDSHTASQNSVARDSSFRAQLRHATPPPGDSSIHTASQSSVARDSSFGEQLGSTSPPGDHSIHTASQSSVARDSGFHVST